MDRSRMLAAMALCFLVAAPICGQETRSVAPQTTPLPSGSYTIAPGGALVPVVPAPPPPTTMLIPGSIQPRVGVNSPPFTTIPAPPSARIEEFRHEVYSVPARLELTDGTTLSGVMQCDSPLPCLAVFGPISVPYNKIRGISWRDGEERTATLFFDNTDSLTVSITIPNLQIKTAWGAATVELSHVRGVILTADNVKWSDTTDGRRLLLPAGTSSDAEQPN